MYARIGTVTHYYTHLGVAAVHLSGDLKIGDTIFVLGHTTELIQPVSSMEIEHKKVAAVAPGVNVAIKMTEPVRAGDALYRVIEGQAQEIPPMAIDI